MASTVCIAIFYCNLNRRKKGMPCPPILELYMYRERKNDFMQLSLKDAA